MDELEILEQAANLSQEIRRLADSEQDLIDAARSSYQARMAHLRQAKRSIEHAADILTGIGMRLG